MGRLLMEFDFYLNVRQVFNLKEIVFRDQFLILLISIMLAKHNEVLLTLQHEQRL